ncbi:MAG: DNA-formamidopyrimidine glycosylase family protein [Planctomycetota bacterium]
MPELPEVEGYVAGLDAHVAGQRLEEVRLQSPFLLRTVEPSLDDARGRVLVGARRLGKRIVLEMEGELFVVVHPMVAGRLRWKPRGAALPGKTGLLALDFERGSLVLTEQGSKKRASLHVVAGEKALAELDPGGLEILEADLPTFRDRLVPSGHTVKRALSSPKLFSGVGNAWSDEILWAAHVSPVQRSATLGDDGVERVFEAARETLTAARDRHVEAARESFPDRVTAFQPEMAVHGRFKEPCPRCGAPIQRITRASGHDFHYCARCQTDGKVLADRSLSRLLKDDWPKRIEELMD